MHAEVIERILGTAVDVVPTHIDPAFPAGQMVRGAIQIVLHV